jgi:hypothetical protein
MPSKHAWPKPPESPNPHWCYCEHCKWRREVLLIAIEDRTDSIKAAVEANNRMLNETEYQFRRACTE